MLDVKYRRRDHIRGPHRVPLVSPGTEGGRVRRGGLPRPECVRCHTFPRESGSSVSLHFILPKRKKQKWCTKRQC